MSISINSKRGVEFWLDLEKENSKAKITGQNASTVKLAKLANAMSNFATIINNKTIPCSIATSNSSSFTDGQTITVSADISNPLKYNVACGLVLHEASHIKLSDFGLLTNLQNDFRSDFNQMLRNKAISVELKSKIVNSVWSSSAFTNLWISTLKNIINVIEDRRIDHYMMEENSGYIEYYDSLYEEYFNTPYIEKTFSSRAMTSGSDVPSIINDYMFYIINIHSHYFTTSHYSDLPRLDEIVKLVDIKRVSRFKNTAEVKEVSLNVLCEIILDVISREDNKNKKEKEKEEGKGKGEGNSEGSNGDSSNGDSSNGKSSTNEEDKEKSEEDKEDNENSSNVDSDNNKEDNEKSGEDNEKSGSGSSSDDSSDSDSNDSSDYKVELTPKELSQIADSLAKQKKFISHEITKATITAKEDKEVQSYSTPNVDLKSTDIPQVEVLTVINPSDSQFADGTINSFYSNYSDCNKVVQSGVEMGKVLAKKIKTRVESRELVTNHLRMGKLDKRRIAAAGFGTEDVFTEKSIFTYSPATIHFTIDASGSMSGKKWNSTIKLVAAIGQAFSTVNNITFKVSLRGTVDNGSSYALPLIIQFFDSSKMKYSVLFNRLKKITPRGSTPEGICFSAIQDKLVKGTTSTDSYLVNLSDGEPSYSAKGCYYSGTFAADHTSKQWTAIKKRNIKTLSYFISSDTISNNYSNSIFDKCYGKDAAYIDTNSITEIAKTINGLLMKK